MVDTIARGFSAAIFWATWRIWWTQLLGVLVWHVLSYMAHMVDTIARGFSVACSELHGTYSGHNC